MGQTWTSGYTRGGIRCIGGVNIPTNTDPGYTRGGIRCIGGVNIPYIFT
jgi:hypothetical protein